jgi:hypothetical protein
MLGKRALRIRRTNETRLCIARLVVLKAVYGFDALPELVLHARERAEVCADCLVRLSERGCLAYRPTSLSENHVTFAKRTRPRSPAG